MAKCYIMLLFAPQELNRTIGVDKTCNFVKVGSIVYEFHVLCRNYLLFFSSCSNDLAELGENKFVL